jgi:hypothetical protein
MRLRNEYVPLSASALVIGAMALVLGSLLNPTGSGDSAAQTLRIVEEESGRWLTMAVMFVGASIALTLGLPAILSLFTDRSRRLGAVAVGVFAVGVIGTCGYAMVLAFFRALVLRGGIGPNALDKVVHDVGFASFLYGWFGSFYLGLLLIAIALLGAKTTPTWVPVLLLAFVVSLPVSSHLGRVGQALPSPASRSPRCRPTMPATSRRHPHPKPGVKRCGA